MNKPKKERFIDPGILTILDDIKFGVIALVGAGLVVAAINGVCAICEWLKTIDIS